MQKKLQGRKVVLTNGAKQERWKRGKKNHCPFHLVQDKKIRGNSRTRRQGVKNAQLCRASDDFVTRKSQYKLERLQHGPRAHRDPGDCTSGLNKKKIAVIGRRGSWSGRWIAAAGMGGQGHAPTGAGADTALAGDTLGDGQFYMVQQHTGESKQQQCMHACMHATREKRRI